MLPPQRRLSKQHPVCRPFRAAFYRLRRTQGVALGCAIVALSGLDLFAQKPAVLPPGVVAQGDKYISQSDGAEMIYIPPGECVIGLAPGTFPGPDGSVIETGL